MQHHWQYRAGHRATKFVSLCLCNKTLCYFSPSLNSVVTDFSFVSTELGILFATNETALTIYNCSAGIRFVGAIIIIIVCLELVIPSVVYSVWTQMVRVGGVFMEVFVVESLTFALYQMGWTLAI